MEYKFYLSKAWDRTGDMYGAVFLARVLTTRSQSLRVQKLNWPLSLRKNQEPRTTFERNWASLYFQSRGPKWKVWATQEQKPLLPSSQCWWHRLNGDRASKDGSSPLAWRENAISYSGGTRAQLIMKTEWILGDKIQLMEVHCGEKRNSWVRAHPALQGGFKHLCWQFLR